MDPRLRGDDMCSGSESKLKEVDSRLRGDDMFVTEMI